MCTGLCTGGNPDEGADGRAFHLLIPDSLQSLMHSHLGKVEARAEPVTTRLIRVNLNNNVSRPASQIASAGAEARSRIKVGKEF